VVAFSFLVGGSAAVGHLMRVRHAENRRLHDLNEQLAAERDLKARAAVAEERARVARELHDVVAHSVSLIAVQAGAAENLMGRDDARARQSLQAVQDAARGALGEMRRLLTILRGDEDDPGLAPQPGLADVGELVDQVRGGGLPVNLREVGPRPDVPAGVDLSAYRIVQEALTNVRKHAGPVPTDVVIEYPPGAVVVEVANDDTAAGQNGDGHGIPGMRERARLYGGTLDVEREGGRHVVRARLPIAGMAE
jgi:signal transduction histidine kinase